MGDAATRLAFGAFAAAGATAQSLALRAFFEWKYLRPDPWRYESAEFEEHKREGTLALVPARRFRRALEIGCSEGMFSARLLAARQVAEFVGVDVAARAVARARRRCARYAAARFERTDVLQAPPAGPFDLIFAAEILYYLGRSTARLADVVSTILAANGLVVLVHPWPEAERLHERFATGARLSRVDQRVDLHPLRPFCVTILAAGGGST